MQRTVLLSDEDVEILRSLLWGLIRDEQIDHEDYARIISALENC